MTAPTPTVYQQGQGVATGDGLNTFVSACTSVAQARGVVGKDQMELWLQGFQSFNDGGQGMFIWSSSATGPDDGGLTTIQPTGVTTGAWLRQQTAVQREIAIIIDGMGTPPPTGVSGDLPVPYACQIKNVTLLANLAGSSAAVDLWVAPFPSFPPTVANTIVGGNYPTLASAQGFQDTTLTGWTTIIPANSVIRYNLRSVATVTRLTVGLTVFG